MKIAAVAALLVSLGANAALLVSWQRGVVTTDTKTSAENASSSRATPVSDAADNSSSSGAGASAPVSAEAWASLQSGDLATLVANLREAGFPPEVVLAIVNKRLDELFAPRRLEVAGPDVLVPYWVANRSRYTSERNAKLRPLMKEQQRMLQELLGPGAGGDELSAGYRQRRYGFLPAEKIDAVTKIESDYGEMNSDIGRELFVVRLPEDREKIALIEKEKRADLEAVLSPEELERYDLYLSPTAQTMRRQLADFAPTEEEFREIFALRRVFEQQSFAVQSGFSLPRQTQDGQASEKTLNAQIQSVLGEQRYAEYERAMDQGYNAATRIAGHFKLPAENAVAVFNLQKTAQELMTAIQSDPVQSPEQRRSSLAALAAETKEKMGALLTPEGVEAYRQTAGAWLRNLEAGSAPPRSTPPPRPAGG